MNLITIPLDQLQRGRYQPRHEISTEHVTDIALSLSAVGQQEPITVTVNKNDPDRYDIVSGEYRWHAAKELKWASLLAIVINECDKTVAVNAISANNSLPLNPIETAHGYARLIDEFGLTHIEVAHACGVGNSRSIISHALRLLKLPKTVRELVASGAISPTHARLLLEAPSDKVIELALKVRNLQWTTQQLKQEIAALDEPGGNNKVLDTRTQDWIELETLLTNTLGSAVSIETVGHKSKPKYKVQIKCDSSDELNDLLVKIKKINASPAQFQTP